MARHLITGGAGFIGSHLAQRLLDEGHEVMVVDNLSGGWRENVPKGAGFHQMDLSHYDRGFPNMHGLFLWKPTHVWHLAAYAAEGLSHWVREHNVKNNWLASTRLINAAIKYGVERFTFASSMAVYGNQTPPFTEAMRPQPEDPYGIAKFSVEQDLAAAGKVFGLPYVIFRPHNVYGPNQNIGDPYRNVVGIFMRKALQGDPITVFGDGFQTRAFSYISDIIDPMVASIHKPIDVKGETFNIGGEQVVTILELATKVARLFPGSTIEHLPERYEVKHAFCDHSKARKRLGFEPKIPLEEGLPRMADWVRDTGVRWSVPPQIEVYRDLPEFWEQYA
jgi:UDP-glucose 4-epimerase